MSYQCNNCGALFEEPVTAFERHGFTYGPYEQEDICPCCRVGGMFEEQERENEELLESA